MPGVCACAAPRCPGDRIRRRTRLPCAIVKRTPRLLASVGCCDWSARCGGRAIRAGSHWRIGARGLHRRHCWRSTVGCCNRPSTTWKELARTTHCDRSTITSTLPTGPHVTCEHQKPSGTPDEHTLAAGGVHHHAAALDARRAVVAVRDAGYAGIEWSVHFHPPYISRQPTRLHRNDLCFVEPKPEAVKHARALSESAGLRISGLGLGGQFNRPEGAEQRVRSRRDRGCAIHSHSGWQHAGGGLICQRVRRGSAHVRRVCSRSGAASGREGRPASALGHRDG